MQGFFMGLWLGGHSLDVVPVAVAQDGAAVIQGEPVELAVERADGILQAHESRMQVGNRRGEGWGMTYLSNLFHQKGEDETALSYARQAVEIGREMNDRHIRGYALTNLGNALAGLGHWVAAADAYRQALTLRQELGEATLAMESQAGLACATLAQGDLSQVSTHVEEILHYLETGSLHGADDPFRIYLTCYQVLQADRHPRARDILDTACRLLQERAAKIGDDALRRSYLQNVPAHRELLAAWAETRA